MNFSSLERRARAGALRIGFVASAIVISGAARAQSFDPPANVNLGIGLGGDRVTGVVGGDLDADGLGDVVGADDASPGNIGYALGTGGLTYATQPPVATTSTNGAFLPTLGDFDLDGLLDVAVAGFGAGGLPTVFFLQGSSAGGAFVLNPPISIGLGVAAGNEITSLAVTDFDGDGLQDVMASITGPNRGVIVVRNTTGFTFMPLTSTSTALGPEEIDICVDFNGDGRKDLVAVGLAPGGNGLVEIFPGAVTPSLLGAPITIPLPGAGIPVDVRWTDCDQDGSYDIAVAQSNPGAAGGNGIQILRNLGAAPFFSVASLLTPIPLGSSPVVIDRLETDFDGQTDLVTYGFDRTGGGPLFVASFDTVKIVGCAAAAPPGGQTTIGAYDPGSVPPSLAASLLDVQDQDFDGLEDLLAVSHTTGLADIVRVFRNSQPVSFTMDPVQPLLGQTTNLDLSLDVPALGNQPFLILFSLNGSLPGAHLGFGLTLPLNPPFLPLVVPGTLPPSGVLTVSQNVTFPAAPTTFSQKVWGAAVVASGGVPAFTTNPAFIVVP